MTDTETPYLDNEDSDNRALRGPLTLYRPVLSWEMVQSLCAPSNIRHENAALILIPKDDISPLNKGTPSDPDTLPTGQSQWHLVGTWGLHSDRVWNDYTGLGSMVAVLDDGFQYTHWDIATNYRTDMDRDAADADNDPAPSAASDNHGTSVIGTIIANDNGTGGVGVAFDAQAYGIRLDFHSGTGTLSETLDGFQYGYAMGFDVINNSWGYTSPFADTTGINFSGEDFIDIINVFRDLVEDGRGGLGSNIVFAAGNSRTDGDNVNYHNMQNSQYVITVAAMDSDGSYSYFSTPGAAILVAAGGTNIWVPDRIGNNGYSAGDYTNFSGTSAAAPIVSGAIAVILEANADLGWRDVQEILAYSTQYNDPGAAGGWQYNGASNWNGGGLHFSHNYGFGAVDLYRAVRLAETWDLQQTSANMTTLSPVVNNTSVFIPATGTITSTITIAQNIEIERAIIDLNISHARAGDLAVTLISPDGTESILIDRPVNGNYTGIYSFAGIDFTTTSNAHWGESSAGIWTLRIQDLVSGNAGTLNNWSLGFTGNTQSADKLYIYTEDFGNFTGSELNARDNLADAGGTDTINLSTISSNTTLNMNGGANSTIAGKTLGIASDTVIERAYLGDGNDTIAGNAANNMIDGGRGNDSITGSAGNDTINGGVGSDTLEYLETIANFTFNFLNSLTVQITHVGTIWMDTVTAVENFVFSDGTYTFSDLETYAHAGIGPPINGTIGNDSLNGTSNGETINAGNGNDRAYGRAGDDAINGDAGDDYLYGDDGNDTISGGIGTDYLFGGNGNDRFVEGAGNDQYTGNAGIDTVAISANSEGFILFRNNASYLTLQDTSGNFGINRIYNDIEFIEFSDITLDLSTLTLTLNGLAWGTTLAITGTAAANTMQGTNAMDTLYGAGGNDTIYGKMNDDIIYGDDGVDKLYGDDGNDMLYGGAGNDILNGGNGNDRLNGGAGEDQLYGGAGTDTAIFSANSSDFLIYRDNTAYITVKDKTNILGTSRIYADVESLEFSDTTINLTLMTFTLNGNTMGSVGAITGTAGNDALNGANMDDTISGGNGNDKINGKAGNDTLNGDSGDDYLYGEAGNDILQGGLGNDYLYGGDGNDTLNGGAGNNYIDGGAGTDIALYSALSEGFIVFRNNTAYLTVQDTTGTFGISRVYNNVETLQFNDVSINLASTTFTLNGAGWGNATAVNGTSAAETINGTVVADRINGFDGNDTINGRAGNDTLYGGNGNDKLYGDEGDDILIGGVGADVLYGRAGNDTFVFDSLGTGADTVADFTSGDRLNITNLLNGYSAGVSDIDQFLQLKQTSSGTVFSVSADGTGANYLHAFTVTGASLSGQSADDLLIAGKLVADQVI